MMMQRRLCVVALFLAVVAAPALGSTLTVTNTSDSGAGSLRDALSAAAPGDTINFSVASPATITLASTLQINSNVTISGPGAASLAISGGNAVTVFSVAQGVTASISGVTIENGNGSDGGAVYNPGGTVMLSNVNIANNSAPFYGAGVLNFGGTVVVTNSTFATNSSAEMGGAIFNEGGTVTLNNSTVAGNSAPYYGGAVYNAGGTLNLTNSTFSNNSSTYYGGAIWNSGYGTVTIVSSTFVGNSSGQGGGIVNYYYSTATFKNSVFANNTGGNCFSSGGVQTSNGYNLSDDASCATDYLNASTDLNNTPAQLDSNGLQNNGGPTQTVALASTSPAVDAVPVAACTQSDGVTPLTVDQRGVTRPQGAACDMGAFELAQSEVFSSFTAKLDARGGANGAFELNATFTLAAGSSGIDPLTQAVQLQIGPYQVTIPAGSFRQLQGGAKAGGYVFTGTIGSTALAVQIVPLGSNTYQLRAVGAPVDFSSLTNPAQITLTIGKNTGTTTVDPPTASPRRDKTNRGHHVGDDRDGD